MLRFLLASIIICLLFLAGCASSNVESGSVGYKKPQLDTMFYPGLNPQAGAKNSEFNINDLTKKYPSADGVILSKKFTARQRIATDEESTSQFNYLRTVRYVVLKPNSSEISNISRSFRNYITVEDFSLVALHPDGTKEQYTLSDLVMKTNNRHWSSYQLPIKGIQRGSIIEYSWLARTTDADLVSVSDPFYLRSKMPVLESDFTIHYPKNKGSIVLKHLHDSSGVTINNVPKSGLTSVKLVDSEGIHNEPFSLNTADRLSALHYVFKPDLGPAYRSNNFWDEYRSEMHGYYFLIDENENISVPEFAKVVDSVLANAGTTQDSIQSIKDWISSSIKIDYQLRKPEASKSVFTRRRGSVYSTALLARRLYAKAGFESDIVELHSAESGEFNRNYTSYQEFNELAIVVRHGSLKYLVLFTRELQPVNVVPDEYISQPYIIVSETASYPDIVENPVFVQDTSTNTVDIDISVSEEGEANVAIAITLTGGYAYDERVELSDMPNTEYEKYVRRWLVSTQEETKNVTTQILNAEQPTKPLVVKATYTMPNAISITPNEAIFQTGGIISSLSSDADTSTRISPIKIWSSYKFAKNIRISYPAAWKPQLSNSFATNSSINSALGNSTRTVTQKSGSIVLEFASRLRSGTYPKEKFSELYEIMGNSGSSRIPNIVFSVP